MQDLGETVRYVEILMLSSQFFCKSKTALKKYSVFFFLIHFLTKQMEGDKLSRRSTVQDGGGRSGQGERSMGI